jgi:hypothetical protein
MKNKAKSPEEKSLLKTFLKKARQFLTILFAMGIDKHLDYDQDETDLQKHNNEKKKGS